MCECEINVKSSYILAAAAHSNSMYFSGEPTTNGSQWISANLSVTGFSCDHAAFMTVKEIVENAIDASKGVAEPSISLHLEVSGDFVEVSCVDHGSGFCVDSVEALTRVFQSKRASDLEASTGKFGIGLKAMVMMSHMKCGGRKVSVSSGIRGTSTSVSFDMGIDASGEIVISDALLRECHEESECTRVTVTSPSPVDFETFRRDVFAYLNELVFARPSLRLHVSLHDEEPEQILPDASGSKPVVSSDPSGTISCSVSVVTGRASDSPTVRLVRCVNNVPLITLNSGGCILRQSFVGVMLKVSGSMGIELDGDLVNDSSVSSAITVRAAPQGSSWTDLVVRVNACIPAADVDYTCLSKDGVVGSKSNALSSTVIARSLRTALKRTQARFRMQFLSNEEFERKLSISKHIPVIAHHLAQIADRVTDPVFRDRVQNLFTSSDREAELRTKLLSLLTPP